MQRLKHPIRAIREPFGKAGLTVAILALVMAMVGGAYAAGGLTKSQEKQVTKIAKKFAGKPGAPGANGTNGTNGTTGPKGDTGAVGPQGPAGTSGKNGTTGFTSTLPAGKTEKGEWALAGNASEEFKYFAAAVSFNIPLAAVPAVHYIRTTGKEPFWNGTEEEERVQSACPGTAAEPEAQSGSLCVYASVEDNTLKNVTITETTVVPTVCSLASPPAPFFGSSALGCLIDTTRTADKTGFAVDTVSKEENPVYVVGTWAVTG